MPSIVRCKALTYFEVKAHAVSLTVDRTVNDAFKFNRETEFTPVLGLIETELNGEKKEGSSQTQQKASSIQDNHHPALIALVAKELGVASEDIHDFEL